MAVTLRCGRVPLSSFVSSLAKSDLSTKLTATKNNLAAHARRYASDVRHAQRRQAENFAKANTPTPLQPMSDSVFPFTAYQIGRGFVGGACVLGIGSLCYYGLGLSDEMGAIDKAIMWSDDVQSRIQSTYMYFGGSIGLTALSAMMVSQNPAMLATMMKNSLPAIGATFVAMIGSGMIVRSMRYKENRVISGKKIMWAIHCGIMGAVVAPLCLLGGPVLVRAAWHTCAITSGLSLVAMCAPSEKFLNMGGPLAVGLGVVFASSVGSMFFPPMSAAGSAMYSVSMYGGLVLFGMFLLYDTQRIIKYAEQWPNIPDRPYDPINASISIYLDVLNLFIRLAMLGGGGGGRKK